MDEGLMEVKMWLTMFLILSVFAGIIASIAFFIPSAFPNSAEQVSENHTTHNKLVEDIPRDYYVANLAQDEVNGGMIASSKMSIITSLTRKEVTVNIKYYAISYNGNIVEKGMEQKRFTETTKDYMWMKRIQDDNVEKVLVDAKVQDKTGFVRPLVTILLFFFLAIIIPFNREIRKPLNEIRLILKALVSYMLSRIRS